MDLSFFEDAEFYDRLNQVRMDIVGKPLMMIIRLSSLGSSLITVISLFGLLFQLNWWLALIALLVPLPLFVVDSRYGLNTYWMNFEQSPRRRQQWYLIQLLTTDTFNKEMKLFNLADFFTSRYRTLSNELYQEDQQLQRRYATLNLLWSILPLLAEAGIYLYIASQAVLNSVRAHQRPRRPGRVRHLPALPHRAPRRPHLRHRKRSAHRERHPPRTAQPGGKIRRPLQSTSRSVSLASVC